MDGGFLQAAGVWIDGGSGRRPRPSLQAASRRPAVDDQPLFTVPSPEDDAMASLYVDYRRPPPLTSRRTWPDTSAETFTSPLALAGLEITANSCLWDVPSVRRQRTPPPAFKPDLAYVGTTGLPLEFGPQTWEGHSFQPQRHGPKTSEPQVPGDSDPLLFGPLDVAVMPAQYQQTVTPVRPRPLPGKMQTTEILREWTLDAVAGLVTWADANITRQRRPANNPAVPFSASSGLASSGSPASHQDSQAHYPTIDFAAPFVWWDMPFTQPARPLPQNRQRQTWSEPPTWYAAPLSMPVIGPFWVAALQINWPGMFAAQVEPT